MPHAIERLNPRHKLLVLGTWFLGTLCSPGQASAEVTLSPVFQPGMVLQQNAEVKVTGKANPGEPLTLTASFLMPERGPTTLAAQAAPDGSFVFTVPTPSGERFAGRTAVAEHTITITGSSKVELKQVLLGEVWLCSGQSNMEWPLKIARPAPGHTMWPSAEEEVKQATNPRLRLLQMPRTVASAPSSVMPAKWTPCTPETAKEFSAVGYFFGRELAKELDVPIGLVSAAWGGTPIEAYISAAVLTSPEAQAAASQPAAGPPTGPGPNPQASPTSTTPTSIAADFAKGIEEVRAFDRMPPETQAKSPLRPGLPTVLYNGMLHPLRDLAIRGVIWYQGEANVGRARQYERLQELFLLDLRRTFGPRISFHFVQIAGYGYGDDHAAAMLREAQRTFASKHGDVGMVVTLDLSNSADIHPDGKQEVGARLARCAQHLSYGRTRVVGQGPMYKSMRTEGNAAVLTFASDPSSAGQLYLKPDGRAGFAVAGVDRTFYPATAVVKDNAVVVSSDRVPVPVAVRYTWEADPIPTLYNEAGLPASGFRTDEWDDVGTAVDIGRTGWLADDAVSTPLFSGKDLTGWVQVGGVTGDDGSFVVKDGTLLATGKGGYLRTAGNFKDVIIELEWMHTQQQGEGAILLAADSLPAPGARLPRATAAEIRVGMASDWYSGNGDIVAINGAKQQSSMPGKDPFRSLASRYTTRAGGTGGPLAHGRWNHERIALQGGRIERSVNGVIVSSATSVSPSEGHLGLFADGRPIVFRNLRLVSAPSSTTPPPAPPAIASGPVWRSLFSGVDFSGWKYGKVHEGHFVADKGLIRFDGKGDDLWSVESFKDFELVVDWRWTGKPEPTDRPVILPSGDQAKDADGKPKVQRISDAGDSGIYLRGSSKSQVNIWCWPCGSGEVYGYRTDPTMPASVRAGVTPKANADKPIGQWNRFLIKMVGDKLSVTLNGVPVLENAELPGVAAEGPIALQKHDGAVEFTNIFIREIK